MTIRLRTGFFIILGLLALWFLYLERAILTPFVLAGIFAYIFNPIVNFFTHKIKLPRTLSVIIIYAIILSIIIIAGTFLTKRVLDESTELKNYIDTLVVTTREQVNTLPDWLRPTANDTLSSLEKSKVFRTQSVFSLFPKAISRILSFFILLFAGFYFLKDGRNMIDKFLNLFPSERKIELEIILRKINSVLGGYLRGQIFLVLIVAGILFACLSVLGVRFALILAIFSGLAEIVPIIGPITAGSIAAFVVLITGTVGFSLSPVQGAIVVGIVYFVVRHLQDYFITPHIMGKITKIHPLLIFFAVLAGGHILGILGYILAVPVAAIIRILLEFSMDKITDKTLTEA